MSERTVVLAIDQGTTNSKAVLVGQDGQVRATASAPVAVMSPRPGWVEQDADQLWSSVLAAVRDCLSAAPGVEVRAVALSTQRESVVGWRRDTGTPVGPVIGWQDIRTASWCEQLPAEVDVLTRQRTGLRVDAMFSAPKLHWLLESAPAPDVRVGTVDAWLVWRLTGGEVHATDAGNASRTLLYDLVDLAWSDELLAAFGVPRHVLPEVRASNAGFGKVTGVPGLPDGVPIVAVMADSHAALFGQGCTSPGVAKATYGTGTSVMTPSTGFQSVRSAVPTTLAWLTDAPQYAREGNIVSSGAALAWTAEVLGLRSVGDLVDLATTVPDAGGVTFVPALAGLGAPHWNRHARARFTGMSTATTGAHLARAAVDAVAHQVCDVADVIDAEETPILTLRADGGATASDLLMRTQADLLGRPVEVADVAEASAVGAARLAWETLGAVAVRDKPARTFEPGIDESVRRELRSRWAEEVKSA